MKKLDPKKYGLFFPEDISVIMSIGEQGTKLYSYKETIPKYRQDLSKLDLPTGMTEEAIHKRTAALRTMEHQFPLSVPDIPVRAIRVDTDTSFYAGYEQLREFKTTDPVLEFPEGKPTDEHWKDNPVVRRYVDWILDGYKQPPLSAVITEKGKVRIIEGHHRAAAAHRAGTPIQVWVALTWLKPLGDGKVFPKNINDDDVVMFLKDEIKRDL